MEYSCARSGHSGHRCCSTRHLVRRWPGWNVTGVSILNQELESTRLERLVEVVPHPTTIAFLVNPESLTADPKLREMENTARMFSRHLQVLNARNESEFDGSRGALLVLLARSAPFQSLR